MEQQPHILPKAYLETQKCEIPDLLDKDPINEPWFDDTDTKSPLSPRSPVRSCIATIQSGAKKGQQCGKPIARDQLCKRHLNIQTQPTETEKVTKRPRLTEYVQGRCVCKTQKGFICGALVKDGGLLCKRHKDCPIPSDFQAEPSDVLEEATTEQAIEEATIEEAPPIVLPDAMDVDEKEPPLEETLLQEREWTMHYVDSPSEMMRLLRTTQVVNIADEQLRFLESKIHACFQ